MKRKQVSSDDLMTWPGFRLWLTSADYLKPILLTLLVWLVTILVLHLGVRELRISNSSLDVDHWWPVSIFLPKMIQRYDLLVLLGVGVGFGLWYKQWRDLKSVLLLAFVGGVLILQTNLLQGFREGVIYPTAGLGVFDDQYWQDASLVHDVGVYLSNYTWLQPNLRTHTRTHPPGPVIAIYLLRQVWDEPMWVMALVLTTTMACGVVMYLVLGGKKERRFALWGLVLLLSLPAVQIYSVFTIDAVVMAGVFLTYFLFVKSIVDQRFVWLAAFVMFGLMWMTFASVIMVPMLVIVEWLSARKVHRWLLWLIMLAALWWGTHILFGYNYVESFQTARGLESHLSLFEGDMVAYAVTRLEAVMELIVFMGPVILYFFVTACFRLVKLRQFHLPVWHAMTLIGMLMGVFISGSFATGETARAALFVWPFVIMVIADEARQREFYIADYSVVWVLVMLQTVLMQTFGWYGW